MYIISKSAINREQLIKGYVRDYMNKVNLESDFGDLTNVCNKLGIVIEN